MVKTGRRNFILALALAAAGCATQPRLASRREPMSFDAFMALSKSLTGIDDLDAEHGRLYFASLSHPADSAILQCWYTGMYESPAGPRVATYSEALAWTTLGFTKAPTLCGGAVGYWGDKPVVA